MPVKILFVSPQAPDLSVGGIERHMKNLINHCLDYDIESVFLMPSKNGSSREVKGKITIIREDFLNFNYKKVFDKKIILPKEIKKKSHEFFHGIQQIIEKERIQVVNAQNFHLGVPPAFNLMLAMACFLKRVPMVLRIHSFMKTELQRSLVNDLDWEKILCVSKSVTGDCFAKGIGIDRLHTQYLGVNQKEFRPMPDKLWLKKRISIPQNAKIILHASRIISGRKDIIKEKGITTLLEAFSKIYPKNNQYRLVIAIATPPKHLKSEFYHAIEKIKGYLKLHNIENGVIMKEFSLADMPLVYNGADLFILASENETFGQVYIEAMACGIPVIGTNVGGISEIITDGLNGFLIEPNNPSILLQKIEEIFGNETLRNSLIEHGLKTIKRKFSSQRQITKMFHYLEQLHANSTTSATQKESLNQDIAEVA